MVYFYVSILSIGLYMIQPSEYALVYNNNGILNTASKLGINQKKKKKRKGTNRMLFNPIKIHILPQ